MSNIVEFDAVSVRYGRRRALDNLTLNVADNGLVVGLFGQNGAGKTTAMRVMCGLIGRYSGVVRVNGSVGFLPDSSFLYGFLTVRQCLQTAGALFNDFDVDVASAIIAELGLSEELRVHDASKGMSEQLHLAIVLARRCRLYVFDEPLAAVDPLTRDKLIEMIRRYRNPESTVIISTHLIAGLEQLFDEAIVIHDGRLILHDDSARVGQFGDLESRVKEAIADHAVAH